MSQNEPRILSKEQYIAGKGERCPKCSSIQVGPNGALVQGVDGDKSPMVKQYMCCFSCKVTWEDIYTLKEYIGLRDEDRNDLKAKQG